MLWASKWNEIKSILTVGYFHSVSWLTNLKFPFFCGWIILELVLLIQVKQVPRYAPCTTDTLWRVRGSSVGRDQAFVQTCFCSITKSFFRGGFVHITYWLCLHYLVQCNTLTWLFICICDFTCRFEQVLGGKVPTNWNWCSYASNTDPKVHQAVAFPISSSPTN